MGVLLGAAAVAFGIRQRPPSPVPADDPVVVAGPAVSAPPTLASATIPEEPIGDLVDAVARTRDAVVNLGTAKTLGAGVIVEERGVVLTNYHVIADALGSSFNAVALDDQIQRPTVTATFENGRELRALVLVTDPVEDLAILRLLPEREDERFVAVSLGDSADLKLGQEVFSIGNPFGLSHTVSRGIVSALDRTNVLQNRVPLVQLDAAINVGNSGGPLFALDGKLMGLVTARRQQAQGIAFALPIDHIRGFLRAVQDPKRRSGAIGVELFPEVSDTVRALGYSAGLLVRGVEEDSPAARAGLRAGDTIVSLRGKRLDGLAIASDPPALAGHIAATVRSMYAGERLPMTIVRGEELVEVAVEIGPATPKRQAFIDAEELLGLRLDPEASVPIVQAVLRESPLFEIARELQGATIVRLFDLHVESIEQLGEQLADVRAVVRKSSRPPTVLIGFATDREAPVLELLVHVR